MRQKSVNNVANLLVGQSIDRADNTVEVTEGTTIKSASQLQTGEVVVCNEANVVLDALTAGTLTKKFKIGTKTQDGLLLWSDIIDATSVTAMRSSLSSAAAEQVSYVGYNGTSGSIEVINNNTYYVRISDIGSTVYDFNQKLIKHGVYISNTTATQSKVALGLADNINAQFKALPQDIKAYAVCSAAGTAISADAGDTVVGVKGSKYLVISDVTNNDNIAVLTVGDFVRIGTATTSDVYKIVSGSTTAAAGGTLTLDRPLVSSVSLAGTTAEYITAAEGAAADWGVKLMGQERTHETGRYGYNKVSFTVTLQDFGDTTVTNDTAMALGKGTYAQISDLEWQLQGAEGNALKATDNGPNPDMRKDVTSGYYSLISIKYSDKQQNMLGGSEDSPKELLVAYHVGSTAGTSATADSTAFTDPNTGVQIVLNAINTKYSWGATALADTNV